MNNEIPVGQYNQTVKDVIIHIANEIADAGLQEGQAHITVDRNGFPDEFDLTKCRTIDPNCTNKPRFMLAVILNNKIINFGLTCDEHLNKSSDDLTHMISIATRSVQETLQQEGVHTYKVSGTVDTGLPEYLHELADMFSQLYDQPTDNQDKDCGCLDGGNGL